MAAVAYAMLATSHTGMQQQPASLETAAQAAQAAQADFVHRAASWGPLGRRNTNVTFMNPQRSLLLFKADMTVLNSCRHGAMNKLVNSTFDQVLMLP